MPADIQVNTAQNGAWEYCFLRETCRGSAQLSLPLRHIPAQMILRLQIEKKSFLLVLISEHSQVSEINAAVIRKLWVKKYLASAEQQESFVFRHFETCLVPYSRGFILELIWACVCHFPCAYVTSVNIRYAYVYACAYAYVAV